MELGEKGGRGKREEGITLLSSSLHSEITNRLDLPIFVVSVTGYAPHSGSLV